MESLRKRLLLITLFLIIIIFRFLPRQIVIPTQAFQSLENLGDQDLIWSYTFGDSSSYDATYSGIPCHDGGFVLTGSTGWGPDIDVLLLRLNESGSLEWSGTSGVVFDIEAAQDVIECESGGYAAIGYRQENWAYGTIYGSDAILVRFDGDGTVWWIRSFGSLRSEQAYSIIECSDGGFAFAGFTTMGDYGDQDFWLVRTNSTGHLMWERQFGGIRNEICHSLTFSEKHQKFVLVGRREINGVEQQQGLIIVTSESGIIDWDHTIGEHNDITICYDVVLTSEGNGLPNAIIVGSTKDDVTGDVDAFVTNIDMSGNIEWEITFEDLFVDEEIHSILRCQNDGYAITGYTEDSTSHGSLTQIWLTRITPQGEVLWEKSYGGVSEEIGWSVTQSHNNDFVITGTTSRQDETETNALTIRVPDSPPLGQGDYLTLNLIFIGIIFGIIFLSGIFWVYLRSKRQT